MHEQSDVFSPEYWGEPILTPDHEFYHGRIRRDIRQQAKVLLQHTVGQLLTGGATTQLEEGAVLDWNSFEAGTVLLLDQEQVRQGKQNMPASDPEWLATVTKRSAKGTLLESSREQSNDFVKVFAPVFLEATNDVQTHYSRYVNLTAVVPNSKGNHTAIDLMRWLRAGLTTKVHTAPISQFRTPLYIARSAFMAGDAALRIREAHICRVGKLELAPKRQLSLFGRAAVASSRP